MAPRGHYRSLANQYAVLAEHTANPLLADGYRKLAEGYRVLADVEQDLDAAAPDAIAPVDGAQTQLGKQDA